MEWLGNLSESLVKQHGFLTESLGQYLKFDEDGWQRLRFQALKSSVRGCYSLSLGLAISHKGVGRHFNAALSSKGLLDEDPMMAVPLGVNGLYLCPHKDPSDLYFSLEDNRAFGDRLDGWLNRTIIPFIEQYACAENYRIKIEETKDRDWVTSNRLSTYGFSVSYWLNKMDKDKAVSSAEAFVKECSENQYFSYLRSFAAAFYEYAQGHQ